MIIRKPPSQFSDVSTVDDNGFLKINTSILPEKNSRKSYCTFQEFGPSLGDPNVLNFSKKENWTIPVKISRGAVKVECEDGNGTVFHQNLHAYPERWKVEKFETLARNKSKIGDNQLSVLLLIIESVSMSEFRRQMPASLDYVEKEMGMVLFKSNFYDLCTFH